MKDIPKPTQTFMAAQREKHSVQSKNRRSKLTA